MYSHVAGFPQKKTHDLSTNNSYIGCSTGYIHASQIYLVFDLREFSLLLPQDLFV